MTLPIQVIPDSNESLAGYIWRLSEANGYGSTEHMRRVFNENRVLWNMMSRPYPEDAYKLLPILTGITGLKEQVFMDTCFSELPRKSELAHHVSAPFLDWRTGFTRICPDCLREHGLIMKKWDMLPYSVCDTHKRKMIHACPSCHSPIQLHADLAHCCHACKTPWESSCSEIECIPAYQTAWQTSSAQQDWLHDFGWMILRAARPMDYQHNQTKYYNALASDLNQILTAAWNLMQGGEHRKNWEAIRAFRFTTLSGLKVKDFHVSPGLPSMFGVPKNLVKKDELIPVWARSKYPTDVISWTVDTLGLLESLGISGLMRSTPEYDHEYFHRIIRQDARSIIDRLGFDHLAHENKIHNRRYDIRAINQWIEKIPVYESLEEKPVLHWIEVTDPVLTIHGVDIIELAKDIRNGRIEGYRSLHGGIGSLGLEPSTYKDWLSMRLEELCRDSVLRYTVSEMTGLSKTDIRQLHRDGIMRYVRGQDGCQYLDGQDVKNYILNNKERLIEKAL